MNSQELFKKAKLATSKLNPLIDTLQMRQTIMLSIVAQWVYDVEESQSTIKIAREAIELIYQELNK